MKKKTLLTAAAILAAMTLLAGCSNSETPNSEGQSSQSSESSTVSTDESSSSTSSETSSTESTSSDTSSAETTSSATSSAESTTSDATSEPETSGTEKPVTVADLALKDGEYTIGVTLEGSSRVKVTSPTKLIIKDGAATAEIEFSSTKYDYMKVGETKYDKINTDGNSKFLIPVSGFDYKMPVIGNTTAMSTPKEIEYTLFFDSKTIS